MSPIKVLYWGPAHGRALALNAMCEHVDADYEFIAHNPQESVLSKNNFAVPAVQFDDGEWYSQMMVAITALGKKLDLNSTDANELKAQNTLTNIYDIAGESLNKRMGFKTRQEVNGYLGSRFSQWCDVLESNYNWADKNGSGPYWEGDNISYVDFILLQFVEQMYFIFGKNAVMPILESKFPTGMNAYKSLRATPKIDAFLATKPIFPDYMNIGESLLEA